MNIRIYTNLENPNVVSMDISSLIHAYEYAVREENTQIASLLKPLFSSEMDQIQIEKTSPIYTFLKSCPMTTEDEITWNEIKGAFLTARLQNNKPVLQALGKVLGHWEQHVLEKNELNGLVQEIVQLPEKVRNYILKYHDTNYYENHVRERAQVSMKEQGMQDTITRGAAEIVRMGTQEEKTYKKAA